ncbi:MAG TPA: N-formylglutamate amidohydrolase [Aurantimonas coralicida]|uniref:N-formylglutamate amidohydrolase n=2 Tax=root TaxID=1 RepID=A0A9C9THY6_9HYPH|nr:N-formylglutamate amidohydrolase [Aurantimonas coralicida]HEU01293.1 N-formylglutamate amidohydrolase [Aurantimonas coralicida]
MAKTPTIETAAGTIPAFEILEPDEPTIPFVFCSPHSGRDYPSDFIAATRLSGESIRRSEDLYVDRLFDFVPDLGAPLLAARFPRAYLDVNREPYELDPKMFAETLPAFVNAGSIRVAGGLGTIPRIVAENEEIYRDVLPLAEGLRRIEELYKPFHQAIEEALQRTRERFGLAILIDCHSMPSSVRALPGGRRPDIVIGDRFGTSAAGRLVSIATSRIVALGYDVARNKPYAGGFITERYGRPPVGFHALQIEINRGLYADERQFRPHAGFDSLRQRLTTFVAGFAAEVAADYAWPAAAE